LGAIDLGEYLDRYRDKQVVLIIAPVGDAPAPVYTCGICGLVMAEPSECPRCKQMAEDWEVDVRTRRLPGRDVLDQVRDLLDGFAGWGGWGRGALSGCPFLIFNLIAGAATRQSNRARLWP
jgi:hypothetical protein